MHGLGIRESRVGEGGEEWFPNLGQLWFPVLGAAFTGKSGSRMAILKVRPPTLPPLFSTLVSRIPDSFMPVTRPLSHPGSLPPTLDAKFASSRRFRGRGPGSTRARQPHFHRPVPRTAQRIRHDRYSYNVRRPAIYPDASPSCSMIRTAPSQGRKTRFRPPKPSSEAAAVGARSVKISYAT